MRGWISIVMVPHTLTCVQRRGIWHLIIDTFDDIDFTL